MRKLILILAVYPIWGATCTLPSGTYPTLVSTSGIWTGCGNLPATGDLVVIAPSAHMTMVSGESLDLGSSASGVGIAITLNATNSSAYGELIVASGASLTLRGFDRTTNRLALVSRYARFTLGGTLLGGQPASVTGFFDCQGICTLQGTSGQHASVGIPSTSYTWNTTATANGPSAAPASCATTPSTCYRNSNIRAWRLTDLWISNAAGTGIGTLGDTSLAISAQACTGGTACTGGNAILQTEVATLTEVDAPGEYWVDYVLGDVYWWNVTGVGTSTTTFTGNYKRLTYTSWYMAATTANTFNQLTAQYTDFTYFGPGGDLASVGWGLTGERRQTDGVAGAGSFKNFSVRDCTFLYCKRPIGMGLSASSGTAGDPLLIERNIITGVAKDDGASYGGAAVFLFGPITYLRIANNVATSRVYFLHVQGSNTSLTITGNAAQSDALWFGVSESLTCSDCLLSNNFLFGKGGITGNRNIQRAGGASGHPMTISSNVFLYPYRWFNFNSYQVVNNNVIDGAVHHGLMAPNQTNTLWTDVTLDSNAFIHFTAASGPCLTPTYNIGNQTQNMAFTHNVLDNNISTAAIEFGDRFDVPAVVMSTGLTVKDNQITNNTIGVLKAPDAVNYRARVQVVDGDYNNLYGNGTAFSGFSKFATFTGLTNVTGVSLQSPSYAAGFASKTLAYTYTSATDVTMTWDGGAPVSIITTGSVGIATAGSATTLTDTLQTWPIPTSAANNASVPMTGWILITGGTGAGQAFRRVTGNTSTVLTVTPAWGTAPAAGSTYVIYLSEITLTAADAETVTASIDARTLPVATTSDSISMSLNGKTAAPSYAASTRTIAGWDLLQGGAGTDEGAWARLAVNPTLVPDITSYYFVGFTTNNPALWCSGSDGDSVGIRVCTQRKALIGAANF